MTERRLVLQPPVLIVDDYQPFVETVRRLLLELGLSEQDIIESSSAKEGETVLRSGRPRSLITSLQFPDGDGVYMIEQMDPKIPTWVVTGQDDPEAERYCREVLRVIDYLTKPVDTEVLTSSLRTEV